ncbi:hypothetical protein GCM10027446_34980 [Angustibacter peucedani]
MTTAADEVAADLVAGMALLASGVPGGYQERGDGVVLNVIGLASAATNTVHVLGPDASRADAQRFVERLQAAGLPFVLRARPAAPSWVGELARAAGLGATVEFPLMRCSAVVAGPAAQDVEVVEVNPADDALVREVARAFTAGNEVPPGVFEPLVAPPMFDRTAVAVYAALDGDAVASVGIRLQLGDAVGVFGVATPPSCRRRGLGAAVTARIVRDGFAAGATTAFLGASRMGRGIYERLGFREVETWTFHVPTG